MIPLPEINALRELLQQGMGVLALPGGGCARYVFSEDVAYRRTAPGQLWLRVDRGNDSYRELVHHSGLNLHIVAQRNPDGTEALLLVLNGHLVATCDSTESRLIVRAAYLEKESGERTALPVEQLGLASD